MKVSCPSCRSTLSIDDRKIPASGARVKCPSCQSIFPVMPGSAVPLPGAAGRAPERVGGAPTTPVPLPGAAGRAPERVGGASTTPVPLPGAAGRAAERVGGAPTTSVPLPGAANPPAAHRPRLASAAVPLPGGAAAPAALRSAPSPGPTTEAPRSSSSGLFGSSVPLPGASFSDEFEPTGFEMSSPSQSVSLPGAALAEQPMTRSPSGLRSMTIPLPGEALVPEPLMGEAKDEARPRTSARCLPPRPPRSTSPHRPSSSRCLPCRPSTSTCRPRAKKPRRQTAKGPEGPSGAFDFGQPEPPSAPMGRASARSISREEAATSSSIPPRAKPPRSMISRLTSADRCPLPRRHRPRSLPMASRCCPSSTTRPRTRGCALSSRRASSVST